MEPTHLLISTFGSAPLLIHESALDSLLVRAAMFTDQAQPLIRTAAVGMPGKMFPRQGADWDGPVDLTGLIIENGLAEIPVYGFIGDRLDPLVKWYFDATDLRDVQREVAQAEADPSVKAVLFTFDSPGGSSRNLAETADQIGEMTKPAASWVDGMSASAAYWLASAVKPIGATRGSDVGSIGVYSTFLDKSQMYKDAGVTVQVFASGKYKGAGIPGTSLTRDQADYIQADVMDLADQFKSTIRKARGDVADEYMQGQSMTAPKALAAGLIDGLYKSKEQFLQSTSLR